MVPPPDQDRDFPLWLVIVAVTGLYLFWEVVSTEIYADVLRTLAKGMGVTVIVTVIAYSFACLLGLGLALAQLSSVYLLRQAARLYVEVMRGIPIIVLLLYVAFVFVPALVWLWGLLDTCLAAPGDCLRGMAPEGWLGAPLRGLAPALDGFSLDLPEMTTRDVPLLWRAVIALTLAYASFLAEVFRAGLLAVPKGQIEAARALGLNRWQRFRHVSFPQAFRLILPPLGNDFVAMVKDSSLVSVLGVTDITQLGKVTAAGNFRYFETYNVVALIYLTMTIGLSLALRRLEKRLRARSR